MLYLHAFPPLTPLDSVSLYSPLAFLLPVAPIIRKDAATARARARRTSNLGGRLIFLQIIFQFQTEHLRVQYSTLHCKKHQFDGCNTGTFF